MGTIYIYTQYIKKNWIYNCLYPFELSLERNRYPYNLFAWGLPLSVYCLFCHLNIGIYGNHSSSYMRGLLKITSLIIPLVNPLFVEPIGRIVATFPWAPYANPVRVDAWMSVFAGCLWMWEPSEQTIANLHICQLLPVGEYYNLYRETSFCLKTTLIERKCWSFETKRWMMAHLESRSDYWDSTGPHLESAVDSRLNQ